jgi:uncharacterized protein (DUF885 family)
MKKSIIHLKSKIMKSFSTLIYSVLLVIPCVLYAQNAEINISKGWAEDPPILSSLIDFTKSESNLRVAVKRYVEDKASIKRRYEVLFSPARHKRLRDFHLAWQKRLEELDFDALNHEGQIDYIALRNRIEYDLEMIKLAERQAKQMAPLLPFGDKIRLLQENRHDRKRVDPKVAAATLDEIANQISSLINTLIAEAKETNGLVIRSGISSITAWTVARQIEHLQSVLENYNTFYDGYDPIYSWWAREPYARADAALENYVAAIDEYLVGIKPEGKAPIIGDPVLANGLRADLAVNMIPYTPEELIAIGEKERDWIINEYKMVSRDMGFGNDWKAALEYAKNQALPPGEGPWPIFEIQEYSEDFVKKLDMITIPALTLEIWRLAMQTPERQKINPFFTGGEQTRVSYPTDGMTHQDKLMSLRGNSPHLNFGSVMHELVPGHYMQGFMTSRFNPHRSELMRTPFWGEGWAQYWEFHLLSRGLPRSNSDKVGMLFWRLHRANRIIFSLNYQLGNWSTEQAVEFLVEQGGFELANAEAEVRRSAMASPLYQVGYMVGALQFRALYQELVESGKMSATEFHDTIILGGRLPVELVRARLTNQTLTKDFKSNWHFYSPTKNN